MPSCKARQSEGRAPQSCTLCLLWHPAIQLDGQGGCAVTPGLGTCAQQQQVLLQASGHPLTVWPICTCWSV